jgi:hypothetical protein
MPSGEVDALFRIHVDALFVVVPVFIFEMRLSAVLSRYLILER